MPDDYYVSQYSGEEIDALLGGAGTGTVRYDAAQTLTDAQKTQARGNISALNGQFLYVNSAGGQIGWYRITEPFYYYNSSGYLTVSHGWSHGGPSELLLGISTTPGTHGKLQCLRSAGQNNSVPYISNARLVKIANTYALDIYASGAGINDWDLQLCNCGHNLITLTTPTFISADDTLPDGETLAAVMEYQNPPMLLGVEYKTTERYLGKPVYTQIINCGSMPNIGSEKTTSIAAFNVGVVTFISGWCNYYGSAIDPNIFGMALSANTASIRIENIKREVNSNAVMYVLVKYTKNTD